MGANEFDGLARIQDGHDPGLVVIAPGHAITQDRGADALGVEATRHLGAFVLFGEDAVAAPRADDDEGRVGLGRRPNHELGDHHVGAVTVLVEDALGVLAGLRLERFGRWGAIPDGDRRRRFGQQQDRQAKDRAEERFHSCRRASIGSRLAARMAG